MLGGAIPPAWSTHFGSVKGCSVSVLPHQCSCTEWISSLKSKNNTSWMAIASSHLKNADYPLGADSTWSDWGRTGSDSKQPKRKFEMLCVHAHYHPLGDYKTVCHVITICYPAPLLWFPENKNKSESNWPPQQTVLVYMSLQSSYGARNYQGIIFCKILVITMVMMSWSDPS